MLSAATQQYDLLRFTLREMTECGRQLRTLGDGAASMEEVASRIVDHLYESLVSGPSKEQASVLVRFFKTHQYSGLPDDLKKVATQGLGGGARPGTKCLTLMATRGIVSEWNSRHKSHSHKAIPLASPEMIRRLPMIAQLLLQLGIEEKIVINPDPELIIDAAQRQYNVFYVPEARGNPFIPDQESFVLQHGVHSIIGFGGVLPSSDMFAVIVFTKVAIPKATAMAFKPFALNTKLALMPFDGSSVFSG